MLGARGGGADSGEHHRGGRRSAGECRGGGHEAEPNVGRDPHARKRGPLRAAAPLPALEQVRDDRLHRTEPAVRVEGVDEVEARDPARAGVVGAAGGAPVTVRPYRGSPVRDEVLDVGQLLGVAGGPGDHDASPARA